VNGCKYWEPVVLRLDVLNQRSPHSDQAAVGSDGDPLDLNAVPLAADKSEPDYLAAIKRDAQVPIEFTEGVAELTLGVAVMKRLAVNSPDILDVAFAG
jgi:hypothetical protein